MGGSQSLDITGLSLACKHTSFVNIHPNIAADTMAHLKTGMFIRSDVGN